MNRRVRGLLKLGSNIQRILSAIRNHRYSHCHLAAILYAARRSHVDVMQMPKITNASWPGKVYYMAKACRAVGVLDFWYSLHPNFFLGTISNCLGLDPCHKLPQATENMWQCACTTLKIGCLSICLWIAFQALHDCLVSLLNFRIFTYSTR